MMKIRFSSNVSQRRDVLGCTSLTNKRFLERNIEVRVDVQPKTSGAEAVYGHSFIINPSLGMYQEIHPCKVSSIGSIKINTSLPMTRECFVHRSRKAIFHCVLHTTVYNSVLTTDSR